MSQESRILIVDDNEDFRRSVADILELRGYPVATANDGLEALELVRQNGVALVLMDVRMPVMDGVETFRRMKDMAPDTPVIMLTAYAVEELIRDALRDGAFGALRKPVDFDQLFQAIEQALPNGKLILLVDDDENLCANLEDVLGSRGYRVQTAYDGSSAIQKAWQNNFDIMLVDLKLPPLNGLETYLAIRDFRPNVAVVMITGYPQEMAELAQQALRGNAYTYLQKPVDMDQLISLLRRIEEGTDRGAPKKPE